MGENRNRPKTGGRPQPQVSQKKEEAIGEALKDFAMISVSEESTARTLGLACAFQSRHTAIHGKLYIRQNSPTAPVVREFSIANSSDVSIKVTPLR